MTDLETIRLMRKHIQELEQRNDELQQRNAQLEVIAALARLLADAEIARMKKLVEDHEASTKPKNKGGRPSNGFDDEFVLGLVNKSLARLKTKGSADRVYGDSDAARRIAEIELMLMDKNWAEGKRRKSGETTRSTQKQRLG